MLGELTMLALDGSRRQSQPSPRSGQRGRAGHPRTVEASRDSEAAPKSERRAGRCRQPRRQGLQRLRELRLSPLRLARASRLRLTSRRCRRFDPSDPRDRPLRQLESRRCRALRPRVDHRQGHVPTHCRRATALVPCRMIHHGHDSRLSSVRNLMHIVSLTLFTPRLAFRRLGPALPPAARSRPCRPGRDRALPEPRCRRTRVQVLVRQPAVRGLHAHALIGGPSTRQA